MDPEDDVETWDLNARLLSYIYKYSIYIRITTHQNIVYIHITYVCTPVSHVT